MKRIISYVLFFIISIPISGMYNLQRQRESLLPRVLANGAFDDLPHRKRAGMLTALDRLNANYYARNPLRIESEPNCAELREIQHLENFCRYSTVLDTTLVFAGKKLLVGRRKSLS